MAASSKGRRIVTHDMHAQAQAQAQPTSSHAWHLVPRGWWQAQPADRDYLPDGFAAEGFIHLTYATPEVIAVGNRYYRSSTDDWLALWIDLSRCAAPVQFAATDSNHLFPHLHGALERNAIVSVHRVQRADDGTFLNIDDLPRNATPAGAEVGNDG